MTFIKIRNISKQYHDYAAMSFKKKVIKYAVKNFSLDLYENEIFALVGESGSGKTTVGRCMIRLIDPDEGQIFYQGIDLLQLKQKVFRQYRSKFQMIFQNPNQALNPRQTVQSCLTEAIRINNQQRGTSLHDQISALLQMVGLSEDHISRFPYELSGGQQQRVVIARAIATNPTFIIADEPTSSIDAVNKKQIISLLKELQQKLNLTILLISHDLAVVSHMADRIGVMYQGELIEVASKECLFRTPTHPYTNLLLQSASYRKNLS